MIPTNKLFHGDCLEILRGFDSESIDLCYIDPPFFSQRDYKTSNGKLAFRDTWQDRDQYLNFMKHRIIEIHRVLKETGSFYLHCDPTMSHYLKILLDIIFGEKNFRNEIVWHYRTGNIAKKQFQRKHDIILFYCKSDNNKFNLLEKKEYYNQIYGQDFKPSFKGRKHGKDKYGEFRFSFIDDVWNNISAVFTLSKEKLGYPTQKPEALLKRIIKASSNEGDVIADFFCGCGTTLSVADRLNRRWIGVDTSEIAIKYCEERLKIKRI